MDRKWIKEIESGRYAPVYLFYGMETFLMEEAIKRLEDAVLGVGEDREWNHTVMDLEEGYRSKTWCWRRKHLHFLAGIGW